MVVHPSAGHMEGTLVNAVMAHCGEHLSGINGVLRPGIVHRIDKDTTGALLICKEDGAHRDLAEQLKEHSIKRRYRAVVQGNIKEDEGTVDAPVGRHPIDRKKMAINHKNGKEAVKMCIRDRDIPPGSRYFTIHKFSIAQSGQNSKQIFGKYVRDFLTDQEIICFFLSLQDENGTMMDAKYKD